MNDTPIKNLNNPSSYHFTDSIRLPWIIESGELRLDTNRIGGFPKDLLWATTKDIGDRTSSAMSRAGRKLWRDGLSQFVRLTLNAADFASFPDITESCPEWTAAHIARLLSTAVAMGERDTSKWLCRSEPLSLDRVIRAEAKSFAGGRWVEIDLSPARCIASSADPHTRGVVIGNNVYMARRELMTDGNVVYEDVVRYSLDELMRDN